MKTRTRGATTAHEIARRFPTRVVRRRDMTSAGVSSRTISRHVAAGRWQMLGQAVVMHSGGLSLEEKRSVALANVGSRGCLTSLTALDEAGLRGWSPKQTIHVLVPSGARVHRVPGLRIEAHQVCWKTAGTPPRQRRHATVDAAVLAAESYAEVRSAIGVLAACVQQRMVTARDLVSAIEVRPRHRHRRAVLAALRDIEMGSEALSEIDFLSLCRSLGLTEPVRQAVRVGRHGERRYLDAEWKLDNGRRIVVEVDGALHMEFEQWTSDLARQNEILLDSTTTLLRFPSYAVRERQPVVIDQLERALGRSAA